MGVPPAFEKSGEQPFEGVPQTTLAKEGDREYRGQETDGRNYDCGQRESPW
jgi:hypothetical protein